jgi:hypothetical protein
MKATLGINILAESKTLALLFANSRISNATQHKEF